MKRKTSTTETISIIFLLLLLIAALWYFVFYKPTTEEIASIKTQTQDVQSNIDVSVSKIAKMNKMQDELNELFESKDASEISVIAPFDNKENVMNQLNNILSVTSQYSLSFSTSEAKDGMVRRRVNVNFICDSYDKAKEIILALENNHWRCIINTLNINSNGNGLAAQVNEEPVEPVDPIEPIEPVEPQITNINVSASITFFESKNISAE